VRVGSGGRSDGGSTIFGGANGETCWARHVLAGCKARVEISHIRLVLANHLEMLAAVKQDVLPVPFRGGLFIERRPDGTRRSSLLLPPIGGLLHEAAPANILLRP